MRVRTVLTRPALISAAIAVVACTGCRVRSCEMHPQAMTAVSPMRSCWRDTVIFVVEDDPQNGLDHVDGYRSIFLAIGPWVKREHLAKQHLSLASIFKTVNLILGLPPLNQYDAAATDLREIFTGRPDSRPYHAVPVPYAKGASQEWINATRSIDFSEPDEDEVRLRAAILKSERLPRPERPRAAVRSQQ